MLIGVVIVLAVFGARKFLPPSLKEELGEDAIATQPLSKFWPADAHESIENPELAALAFAARAEVPAKPRNTSDSPMVSVTTRS